MSNDDKPRIGRKVYAIRNVTDFLAFFVIIIILLSLLAYLQGGEQVSFRWVIVALCISATSLRLEVLRDHE